jgi:hypothetical protein
MRERHSGGALSLRLRGGRAEGPRTARSGQRPRVIPDLALCAEGLAIPRIAIMRRQLPKYLLNR